MWGLFVLFVRSGQIYLHDSALRGYGRTGYSWSNISVNYSLDMPITAYDLAFSNLITYTSYGPDNRWNGFPVRCLVILCYVERLLIISDLTQYVSN